MALYVNTNVSSIDLQRNIANSAQAGNTENKIHTDTNVLNSGSIASDEVVDITDSLSSILTALGVDKSRMKAPVAGAENIEKPVDSGVKLRNKDFAAEAVKMAQSNILNQGATSILAQANQKTLYALSLLED